MFYFVKHIRDSLITFLKIQWNNILTPTHFKRFWQTIEIIFRRLFFISIIFIFLYVHLHTKNLLLKSKNTVKISEAYSGLTYRLFKILRNNISRLVDNVNFKEHTGKFLWGNFCGLSNTLKIRGSWYIVP